MTNQVTIHGKKQPVDITAILNNSSDRAKLQNFIDEVIVAKTKILDQNEHIKSIRDAAVEEIGIAPKMFNSLVSLMFNNNFDEKLEEMAQLEAAITALMQTSLPPATKSARIEHDAE